MQFYARGGAQIKQGAVEELARMVKEELNAKAIQELLRVSDATSGPLHFSVHFWPRKKDECKELILCESRASQAVQHAAISKLFEYPTVLSRAGKELVGIVATSTYTYIAAVISASWPEGRAPPVHQGYPLIAYHMDGFHDPTLTSDTPLQLEHDAYYLMLEAERQMGNMLMVTRTATETSCFRDVRSSSDLALAIMAIEPSMLFKYMTERYGLLGDTFGAHASFLLLHILAYSYVFFKHQEQFDPKAIPYVLGSLRPHIQSLDMIAATHKAVCATCNESTEGNKCGRCRCSSYCSVACQRAQFPEHKTRCIFAGKMREALGL